MCHGFSFKHYLGFSPTSKTGTIPTNISRISFPAIGLGILGAIHVKTVNVNRPFNYINSLCRPTGEIDDVK